ncbi:MAG: biosynthetic arginine decarboxylase, partial [Gammaproteobacteria bacterium]
MNDVGWNAASAKDLYNVQYWGEGYFDVAESGHLLVRPTRNGTAIDLYELARGLPAQGLALPVLLRFSGILHDRVDALTGAFNDVIVEQNYGGRYTAVYPIKVNQQKDVVDAIVRHGGDRVGLEAGSKPELAAVLGLARPGALVVCNGYKDRAYLRRALIGQKLGHRVYIVVEKTSELPMLLSEAKDLMVEPLIGLRVRLGNSASTQQNTGGEKAKFGLAAAQVLEAMELLKQAGKLGCLRMVHFHLGSQVANVADIQRGMREAARYYVELRGLGAPLDLVDVGGGLGVDYEGTRSRSFCSINYSLREYAHNIVRTLQEVCRAAGQPEPNIVSESGRALTAHHAVLLTQVVDHESPPAEAPAAPGAGDPVLLHDLHATFAALAERPPLECLHDARHFLVEAQAAYTAGTLSVVHRAKIEQAYYAICRAVVPRRAPAVGAPPAA